MDWKYKRVTYMCDTYKNKGPCLVPKPGREAPSCHENDFCECDMYDAYRAGREAGLNEVLKFCHRMQADYCPPGHYERVYISDVIERVKKLKAECTAHEVNELTSISKAVAKE